MNDIVITFSKNVNTDGRLRSILRAIEAECDGYNEIFIVGDKPDWVQGVAHVGFFSEESKKFQLKNLYRKLRGVCLRPELTENFYWIDAGDKIPKFDARESLRVSVPQHSNFYTPPRGTDKISIEHTRKIMARRGFSDRLFFNKFPISLSKTRLSNTFDEIDFETAYGYCIKTMYCNFNRLQPTCEYAHAIDLTKYIIPSSYEKIR